MFLSEEFFNGRLEGWGVLENLVGGLQKPPRRPGGVEVGAQARHHHAQAPATPQRNVRSAAPLREFSAYKVSSLQKKTGLRQPNASVNSMSGTPSSASSRRLQPTGVVAGVAHGKQVRRRVERTPNRIRDAQRFRHRRFTAALANVTAPDCDIVSNPTSPSHLDLWLRSHASISSRNPPPGSNRGLLLFPPPGSHRARSADRPVAQAPPPFCRDDRPGSGRCGEILPGAQ